MEKEKTAVTVVIPIHTTQLSKTEKLSIERCFDILGRNYPIVFVKPEDLDITGLNTWFPKAKVESFDPRFFENIGSYNRLMLSAEFYQRFIYSEYILIYQTDSFVFFDALQEWCEQGFDYVGAPWLPKKKYARGYYRAFIALKRLWFRLTDKPDPTRLFYAVGNGGFSLRKTSSHLAIASSENFMLNIFRKHADDHDFNEDIFWALEVNRSQKDITFSYPHYMEAFRFSFDKSPEDAFELSGEVLPFGCHGWSKEKMRNFWRKYID